MRRLALAWPWLLAGAFLAGVPTADSHQRSMSYSIWELDDDGARVHARVSQLDLSRLGLAYLGGSGPNEPVSRYLASRLTLRAGDDVCRPALPPALREGPEGWLVYAWRVDCDAESQLPRTITSALFLEAAPSSPLHAGNAPGRRKSGTRSLGGRSQLDAGKASGGRAERRRAIGRRGIDPGRLREAGH